jgi:hypothetical protein
VARVERQFSPSVSARSKVALGLGLAGSAALGAGVFGAWIAADPVPGSTALLLLGLVGLASGHFLEPRGAPPVRVGGLGVTIGDPKEAARVPWCDIESVRITGEDLALGVSGKVLLLPLGTHGRAATRIIAEASRRIEARVDVSPKAHERLPPLREEDGESVPAERLQVTGRKCAASGTVITFEKDARLCANCAALYHVAHVPPECKRCSRLLQAPARVAS